MKLALCFGGIILATASLAAAQQPATQRAETGPTATTAPPGWAASATDTAATPSPSSVSAYGAGVRIAASTPTTLYRPAVPLTGDGTVGAVVLVDRSTPDVYGLTLGGENGLAFLVRLSGGAAIAPLSGDQVGSVTWTPAPAVSMPPAGLLQPCRLEVRVQGTRAALLVDGTLVASTTIAAKALDGGPGIYTGAGTLIVAGFTTRMAMPAAGVAK